MRLFCFRLDKTKFKKKKTCTCPTQNESSWKKDTKQKNVIHQHTLYTHFSHSAWWAAFTWCHLSESLAIIFSSHLQEGFDFAETTQPDRARRT